ATGVRFRRLPLTPERVLAGLGGAPLARETPQRQGPKRASRWSGLGAAIAGPDASTWSAATIEHGRQLAALGACQDCHTAENGAPYVGGLALATPFGTVMTTNITPDVETG